MLRILLTLVLYALIKKILFQLDPETAHSLAKLGSLGSNKWLLAQWTKVNSPTLTSQIGTTPIKNPIGLAAGFDKNGDNVQFLQALGFGYLELGSVTALSCPGNPKPRVFRLPSDHSIINRMGLPNKGADAFVEQALKFKKKAPIGVNISKTPDFAQSPADKISGLDDYLTSFIKTGHLGAYVTINLSCPNSGESRTFEHPDLFADLARELQALRRSLDIAHPVFIKLGPDSPKSQMKKTIELALKYEFDGFVMTNTTIDRPSLKSSAKQITKIGKGGLSGKALEHKANLRLKDVYEIVGHHKTIIGVGGLHDFEGLVKKLSLGAQLFQVYTGFIYNGPLFMKKLNQQLVQLCHKLGVKNYNELVGQNEIVSSL